LLKKKSQYWLQLFLVPELVLQDPALAVAELVVLALVKLVLVTVAAEPAVVVLVAAALVEMVVVVVVVVAPLAQFSRCQYWSHLPQQLCPKWNISRCHPPIGVLHDH
jgi:hypothetical protein